MPSQHEQAADRSHSGYQMPQPGRDIRLQESHPDSGAACVNLRISQIRRCRSMKTYMANPDKLEKKWYVVDASGMVLGRLASEVAKVLRGKNKPEFTPHVDTGDYVIVVNAEKIRVSGKKLDQKVYYHHSGYVGGMKETTLKEMLEKHPDRVVKLAVQGMLPKGPLGREMLKKLHVYTGPEHPHAAQKPEELTF